MLIQLYTCWMNSEILKQNFLTSFCHYQGGWLFESKLHSVACVLPLYLFIGLSSVMYAIDFFFCTWFKVPESNSANQRQQTSIQEDQSVVLQMSTPPCTVTVPPSPLNAASTLSSPSSNNLSSNIFKNQSDFIQYLSNHPKSKKALAEISEGNYSISARRAVTQVAVAKLIDIHGHYVSSAAKTQVSQWLADITQMKPTDYFDPKTHRGFLNKDILNRRRSLTDSEKRWTWAKKLHVDVGSESDNPSGSPPVTTSAVADASTEELEDLDGCPRNVADCEYCQGNSCLVLLYLKSILS
jgi:hypothetical protein